MGLRYALSRSGPMAVGINQAGAFLKTVKDSADPRHPVSFCGPFIRSSGLIAS